MKRTGRKNILLLMLLSLLAMASCTSYKKVPYIQNSRELEGAAGTGVHEARIMPQDVLNITIFPRNWLKSSGKKSNCSPVTVSTNLTLRLTE